MEDERFVRPKLEAGVGFSESVMSSVAEAVNKIKNALQENQQKEQQTYVSVTDAAFTERLEKAMLKNFDYLRRKDAGLLNYGPKGGSQHQQSFNRSAQYAGKAPVRLGVGSAAPVPATSAAASVSSSSAGASAGNNAHPNTVQEPTSVYVSGLPTDISEEELEILFGSLGRIKKVKIYTTPLGKQKGDALITFALSEYAITACFKFNGLDIGDGHVIKVAKAEFTAKSDTAKSGNKSGNGTTGGSADDMLQIVYGSTGGLGSGGGSGSGGTGGGGAGASTEQGFHNHFVHSTSTKNDIDSRANTTIPPSTTNTSTHTTAATNSNATTVPSILYTLLPVETEAGVHPVTLILNAFDPANAHDDDPNYFDELETDMLLECCNFGKVRTIQLLTLPPHYLAALSGAPHSRVGSVLGGAIGVTFEVAECADNCASGLMDRRFDGRVLKTYVLPPLPASGNDNNTANAVASASSSGGSVSQTNVPPPPRPPSIPNPYSAHSTQTIRLSVLEPAEKDEVSAPDIEAISNDVDDFLNSLL